ncbi:MAG: class I SAM-dependent methyltransferase [Acidobacteriota bacterium]
MFFWGPVLRAIGGLTPLWEILSVDDFGTALLGWAVLPNLTEELDIEVNGVGMRRCEFFQGDEIPWELLGTAIVLRRPVDYRPTSCRFVAFRAEPADRLDRLQEGLPAVVTAQGSSSQWRVIDELPRAKDEEGDSARKIPPLDKIARVCPSLFEYLCLGATDFLAIDNLLRRALGRPLASFRSVLDWGCGAGRMTRHLIKLVGSRVVAADIDSDNVSACQRYIGSPAEYCALDLLPPTNFEDGEFDLIIGVSVLTHLNEQAQFAWLRELRRICKRGGVLVTSIVGLDYYTKLSLWGFWEGGLEGYLRHVDTGFALAGCNSLLSEQISEEGYYVNVAHSHRYVEKEWARFFRVVDIVPGLLGHQDAVLLQAQ